MKVIAHHGVACSWTCKNVKELGNLVLYPRFSVVEGLLQVRIPAAEPRTPNMAGNAVDRIRLLALGCSDATLFPRRIIPAVSLLRVGFASSVCGVGLKGKSGVCFPGCWC